MKPVIRSLVVFALAWTVAAGRGQAQEKGKFDLTGTWQIDYQDDNGVSMSRPRIVFKQTEGKLTGIFGNKDWPIIGTVDGNHIVFTFIGHGHENNKPISDTIFYWGTVESSTRMKGRMKSPKESGDWTATRK